MTGFSSSMALPVVKLYQNGTLFMPEPDLHYYLGFLVPFGFVGLLMGAYAIFVEKEETNSKRLFRTCVAMPGLLLSLMGTQAPVEAVAKASTQPGTEVVCSQKNPIAQGVLDTFDMITNNHRERFVSVSTERLKGKNKYLLLNGKKYWILGAHAKKPEQGTYVDLRSCLVKTQ